jgi:two-component system, NarL family, sensor histidine kinase EvgS
MLQLPPGLYRYFVGGLWAMVCTMTLAQPVPFVAVASAASAVPAGTAQALPLSTAEREFLARRGPLRVATKHEWSPIDPYTYEGQYRGLSGEFLYLVGQRLGIGLEIVHMPTLADGLQALKDGRADVVPSVAQTPQRAASMRFSKSYLDVPNVYLARRGVSAVGEAQAMPGLRVAVERGYAVASLVRERHPLAVVVEFDDTTQALRGVSEGSADVYLGALPTTTFMVEKLLLSNLEIRGPWRAEHSRLHLGVRSDDAQLQGLLDKALDSITLAERQAIHRRWVPLRTLLAEPPLPLALSASEAQFVASMPALRVSYDEAHFPYTFRDANGQAAGMALDMLATLAERVGLTVGPAEGGTWTQAYANARQGQADVLVAVADNEERRRDFLFVGPWVGTPTVLVTRGTGRAASLSDLNGGRVAVLQDGQHQYLMRRHHAHITLLALPTRDDLMAAVADGRVDAALCNLSFAVPRLQSGAFAGLKIASMLPEFNTDLYLAVRRDQPQLAALLDRALASMTEAERSSIASRWAVLDSMSRFSSAEVLRRALPWLLALLLALAVSLMWGLRLARQVRFTRAAEQALALERDRAQALARARGDFVMVASHEIRTPVNAVIGALDMLGREALSAAAARALGLARRAATNLQEFVNNLLDLSKSDAGRLTIHAEDEDVAAALADVLGLLGHLAEHKGVQLLLHTDPALAPRLHVDPMRLRQVVMNLLSNAIKFTPACGQVDVRVTVGSQDSASQQLVIEVVDTGSGIAPEHVSQLFQPFEQAHAAAGLRAQGSGLGLVLVKRVVEAMGGSVQLSSQLGLGTRVSLQLRLARRAAPVAGGATAPRVLVVDDDPVQRLVLEAELKALGCAVDVAPGGAEALLLWRRYHHRLVLTDCRMPGMDGMQFTRRLRAEPGGAAVHVVGTSADVDDANAGLAAGMQRLVPKPVPRALLRDLLHGVAAQVFGEPSALGTRAGSP